MSADNRILVHQHTDGKWYVWHASCSMNYHEPPKDAWSSNEEDDAWEYARKEANDCTILEGGVEKLSDSEIIEALRDEIEILKDPTYCPGCGACGEELCCSGSMCKKNQCHYGETYAKDYEYNRKVADRLYEVAAIHDKLQASRIVDGTYKEVYHNEEYKP